MDKLKWVGGGNLLILLLYTIILHLTPKGYNQSLGIMIGMAFFISIQVGLNLLISLWFFVTKDKPLAKSFLLSAGTVLLIGFSVCLGWSG